MCLRCLNDKTLGVSLPYVPLKKWPRYKQSKNNDGMADEMVNIVQFQCNACDSVPHATRSNATRPKGKKLRI